MAPKIQTAKNLLKFGTSRILNMPIPILMLKIIFIKYLPPVSHKLVPKLKMLMIYGNLTYWIFRILGIQF